MVKDSNIYFYKEEVKFNLQSTAHLKDWLGQVLNNEKKSLGEISFIFCTDKYLLKKNVKYLKTNTLTDVIAFDYGDRNLVSGDVFISFERVKENAETYNVSVSHELRRVMVHGLLHLLGFSDKTKSGKSKMTLKEDLYLSLFSPK